MPPRKTSGTTAKATTNGAKKTATRATAPKKAAPTPKAAGRRSKATENASKNASDDSDNVADDAPEPSKPTKKPVASKKTAAATKTNGTTTTIRGGAATQAKKPTKVASKKETAKSNGVKRKVADSSSDDDETDQREEQPKKKARTIAVAKKRIVSGATRKLGKAINTIPSTKLDIFVFGEGTAGELGLGSKKFEGKKVRDVKRPRINHNLDAEKVGVVQMACGGMHAIALTHDNRILTWGVNDSKSLGRDTTWEGGTRDVDDESDDEDDEDTGVNPMESTPGEVDMGAFIPGTKIAQVAACDSASFVLTEDGSVYGWGTFRGADGVIGFTDTIRTQPTPMLLPDLKNITKLACGANHVLALDISGKVYSWGSGGQYQLGRKPVTRHGGVKAGLKPEACGRFTAKQHAVDIAAGSYHSFYLDNHGKVWSWGLNNFSQTGHSDESGMSDAMVLIPRIVESLEDFNVVGFDGGEHHSVACTEDGKLLTWGRVDGHQVGLKSELFNQDNAVYDDRGKPRILIEPTPVPDIEGIKFVTAGTDSSLALNDAGRAYSWGFSGNYQTGQGTMDDIEVPTLIDNTAVKTRKLVWAGAGGQFSALAAPHDDKMSNGH